MSKIAEFKALEAQLAEQLKQLESLKNDGGLKREIEFETKLRALMAEYNLSLRQVISIIEPERAKVPGETATKAQRRVRLLKTFKNPNTGEIVETKGGNHKVLKAWKQSFGAETVEGWIQ